VDIRLKVLEVMLNHLQDPKDLALVREAYHAVSTGVSQSWAVERPNDVIRMRELFDQCFIG